MSKFSENLKQLRMQRCLSQDRLAQDLGLSKSAISMYENGNRTPNLDILEALAAYFHVTLSALSGAADDPVFRVPVVDHVVAGVPTQAVEDIVDWEEIPHAMARHGDYIGLKVKGSCMEPRFVEGDTVIVRRQPDVQSGEIAIVFVNGDEATMKKVLKQPGGILLAALNPSVYEPHYYSNEQILDLPITIYGKVVELRGKF